MKLIKKATALLLSAAFVCATSVAVYAQPLYSASISLNSDIKKSDVTYLSLNESFDITLKLKTGKNYYAGPFAAQVFYTKDVLKYKSGDFNKSGKFYSTSKSQSGITASSAMTANSKNKFYPADWNTTQRAKYDFCSISMVPNTADASTSVDNFDETIATLHFSAGSSVLNGTVFISASSLKSASNPVGATYLSCLTDSGKILSSRYDYGADAALDLAKASLSFTVSDLGDADGNKKLNSSDALLILQHASAARKLTGNALIRGDLDSNSDVNAIDALYVLQLVTGLIHLNSIIKR